MPRTWKLHIQPVSVLAVSSALYQRDLAAGSRRRSRMPWDGTVLLALQTHFQLPIASRVVGNGAPVSIKLKWNDSAIEGSTLHQSGTVRCLELYVPRWPQYRYPPASLPLPPGHRGASCDPLRKSPVNLRHDAGNHHSTRDICCDEGSLRFQAQERSRAHDGEITLLRSHGHTALRFVASIKL
ncbi:hypothetical protein N658DRAFT_310163 [Parathielavia hyrcaniae]|uniref:Uncharacterized protein n=1 Tax=Parathielavia hyrcaniae TaxID=113614 RepID=A0AAN6Q6Z8_9PEZI|nr:hypothetical protein N658DRAFT_310163 [Parathielavia hyrcaniae]